MIIEGIRVMSGQRRKPRFIEPRQQQRASIRRRLIENVRDLCRALACAEHRLRQADARVAILVELDLVGAAHVSFGCKKALPIR